MEFRFHILGPGGKQILIAKIRRVLCARSKRHGSELREYYNERGENRGAIK
jgi:hypothetical protein